MSRYEAMQYAGVVLIVAGLAYIYWPLAVIVAGLALVILAQAGGA